MAKIKPFQAVSYNRDKIKDLSKVTCPPYDIISPLRQEYYHSLSPYNFIHIILGKDIPGEDKYERAGGYFRNWLKDKILVRDGCPAFYFYSQQYNLKGEKKVRLGFVGLLHLEDNNSSIFGHEHTRLEPKEDRLRILKEVRANLSPIFVLFNDNKRIIQTVYQQHVLGKEPFMHITDDEQVVHKLWRLDSEDVLSKIQAKMQDENIFIADGHHRYEVACAYRKQMKEKRPTITADEDFNYILTYFTNTQSQGLVVLPVHRLVRLNLGLDWQGFLLNLKDYFDVDEVKDKKRFLFLMQKAGFAEHVLGMYKDKRYWLLRLRNIRILDKLMADKPKVFRSLDVSVLNYIVLKKILGLNLEDKENITFSPHDEELIKEVDSDDKLVAFFLNPVKVEQIVSVALDGERMPPKTTYFYPKVLSGLVINKHEER